MYVYTYRQTYTHMYIHINYMRKYNLLGLYNLICIYVFRVDHLVSDNELVFYSGEDPSHTHSQHFLVM